MTDNEAFERWWEENYSGTFDEHRKAAAAWNAALASKSSSDDELGVNGESEPVYQVWNYNGYPCYWDDTDKQDYLLTSEVDRRLLYTHPLNEQEIREKALRECAEECHTLGVFTRDQAVDGGSAFDDGRSDAAFELEEFILSLINKGKSHE